MSHWSYGKECVICSSPLHSWLMSNGAPNENYGGYAVAWFGKRGVPAHNRCLLRLIDKTAPAYLTDVAREALR